MTNPRKGDKVLEVRVNITLTIVVKIAAPLILLYCINEKAPGVLAHIRELFNL